MRISDWSSDVCSSDLALSAVLRGFDRRRHVRRAEKHHCRARARLAAGAAAMIDMEISSEQRQIVDSVQNLLADALPYDRFVPRPTPVPNADRAVFTQFGELGVFGLGLAEASGGVGHSLGEEVLVDRESTS